MLQPRTAGPFRVITVQVKTLTIDEHGIRQTVSIDCVMSVPDITNSTRHQLQEKSQHKMFLSDASSRKDASQDQEFVVDEIVRHVSTETQTKYVVRWYGYCPSENTVHPPEHITPHCVVKY